MLCFLIWLAYNWVGYAFNCNNGPYLYDLSCNHYGYRNEGIGGSTDNMKMTIVFAQIFSLKLIPNPECFRSKEMDHPNINPLKLMSDLGYGRNTNCSYLDAAYPYKSNKANENDSMQFFELNRVGYYRINLMYTKEHFKRTYRDDLLRYCDNIIQSKGKISYKNVGMKFYDSLLQELYNVRHKIDKSTIIVLNPTSHEGNSVKDSRFNFCVRSFLANQLSTAMDLDSFQSRNDPQKVNIAIHYRYGDVATTDLENVNIRSLRMSYVIQLLEKILGPASLLANQSTSVTLYTEGGNLTTFEKFSSAFRDGFIQIGNGTTVSTDIRNMARADILILSNSQLSYLIGAYNLNGVLVFPPEITISHELTNIVFPRDILKNDLKSFNAMLCKQKLYSTDHRDIKLNCKR